MTTASTTPTWKLTSPSAVFVAVLAAFMLFLGVNGHLNPIPAAIGFGLPDTATSTAIVPWMHVKAGRDIGIGLMIVALLAARERRALGWLITVSMVMPITDALTILSNGASVAYALAVHGSAVLYGLLLGPWLLHTSRREELSPPRQDADLSHPRPDADLPHPRPDADLRHPRPDADLPHPLPDAAGRGV